MADVDVDVDVDVAVDVDVDVSSVGSSPESHTVQKEKQTLKVHICFP